MPILWRYMLSEHLRVFGLAVTAFIVVLLTLRLDEIAHFISLGAPSKLLFSFILFQIPYILPIALPVSSLIASILLVQRFSSTRELTAMRSSNLGLSTIFMPIILASLFFSLCNFAIVSEIATTCHRTNNQLKRELRSINPLLLLHNKHLLRLKGMYYEPLGPTHVGESAEQVVFAMPDVEGDRIRLLLAQEFHRDEEMFVGENVTVFSSFPGKTSQERDNFWLENMNRITSSVYSFSPFFANTTWGIHEDYFSLPLLWLWGQEGRRMAKLATDPVLRKKAEHQWYRALSEISRRASAAFAVFSFTLLGLAFGITVHNSSSKRGIFWVILLAALYLISYFSAKNYTTTFWLATMLYIFPHCLLVGASLWNLYRVTRGRSA